jgi:hypothetical protein
VIDPLRTVTATRYVEALREGGSLPGLVEADDCGLYVVKFRGAGQGAGALAAEVVCGELARALGLPVPDLVLVDMDPELARAEPDPEIQDLLKASPGANAGLDFLPGALMYQPGAGPPPDPRAEELRRKLAQARDEAADEHDFEAAGMAGETQLEGGRPLPPAAAMSGGDIADARRRVHEEARTATDEMRRSDEPETR